MAAVKIIKNKGATTRTEAGAEDNNKDKDKHRSWQRGKNTDNTLTLQAPKDEEYIHNQSHIT
jgi:hypothetical protein